MMKYTNFVRLPIGKVILSVLFLCSRCMLRIHPTLLFVYEIAGSIYIQPYLNVAKENIPSKKNM